MKGKDAKQDSGERFRKVIELISADRERTNILKSAEYRAIAYLVERIPPWVSPNVMTAIGFAGSAIVFAAFVLAYWLHIDYLLLGVVGFMISWFGDSLDGRLAYYRKIPRRRYGFVLDVTIDWISIIIIGGGYMVYTHGPWELLGYAFVAMYGWEMIIALMRYKITGNYSIDSGKLGPTEARIIISVMLITEVLFPGSIDYFALFICMVLLFVNIIDTKKLLRISDEADLREKKSGKV
jgi:phosphatidylglycerophosphate synthase